MTPTDLGGQAWWDGSEDVPRHRATRYEEGETCPHVTDCLRNCPKLDEGLVAAPSLASACWEGIDRFRYAGRTRNCTKRPPPKKTRSTSQRDEMKRGKEFAAVQNELTPTDRVALQPTYNDPRAYVRIATPLFAFRPARMRSHSHRQSRSQPGLHSTSPDQKPTHSRERARFPFPGRALVDIANDGGAGCCSFRYHFR